MAQTADDVKGKKSVREYLPILDDRRLDDELAEARRILRHFRLMFTSANGSPVRSRHIGADHLDIRDTTAFFERWLVKTEETE